MPNYVKRTLMIEWRRLLFKPCVYVDGKAGNIDPALIITDMFAESMQKSAIFQDDIRACIYTAGMEAYIMGVFIPDGCPSCVCPMVWELRVASKICL